MSERESGTKRRGFSLAKAAAVVLAVGWAPLLLYIPFDALRGGGGNPIGLGLLMVASTLLALVLLGVAAARTLYQRIRHGFGPRS